MVNDANRNADRAAGAPPACEKPKMNEITSINLLWLDLQGVEPDVLMASTNLSKIEFIYSEVSVLENYENQILYKDYKNFMIENGFTVHFEDIRWEDGGNVLFKNKSFVDNTKNT